MVDLSTYQPPGVYVEEDVTSVVSISGASPTVIGIVGPGLGYRTFTEIVNLVGTTPVVLAKRGISTATDFTVTGGAGGALYAPTDDYTISVVDAGVPADQQQIRLTRVADGDIVDGAQVYVTYRYTDATYFQPVRATNLDDIQGMYGQAIDLTTGVVTSPLSLAAKFAFDNGAGTLVLVATRGTTPTTDALKTAYSSLDAFSDVNIIVPLPVGISGTDSSPGDTTSVGIDLMNYIVAQEALGTYRIGIVGLHSTASVDPAALVTSYRNKRMMHAHPNRLLFFNSSTSSSIEISGYYLAAAYAGRFAAQSPQTPLTKKVIRGFAGLPATAASQMTTTKKNTWSDLGVAVTEVGRDLALTVRHGTSTDRTNTLTREISLVRARDYMVNLLQTTLDSSGLIGSYIEADTTTAIGGVIEGILETAKTLDYIVDYSNVTVRQRGGLPSVIDVKFRYKPAYPLNYISVVFSVDTSTGETTVQA